MCVAHLYSSTPGCCRSNSDLNPGILPNIVHKVKTPVTEYGTLVTKRVGKKFELNFNNYSNKLPEYFYCRDSGSGFIKSNIGSGSVLIILYPQPCNRRYGEGLKSSIYSSHFLECCSCFRSRLRMWNSWSSPSPPSSGCHPRPSPSPTPGTLLEKFWSISLHVTDDAIAKL